MAQENFDKDNVSTSKFYMLRCIVAMAHADGHVCDEERAYIHALMNRLPFSNDQRETLESDLENEQDIGTLFAHINDPRYRGQVVYFARILAYKDGKLDIGEQALLDKLHAMATEGLDMDAIRGDVKKAVSLNLSEHDVQIDHYRSDGGIFGLLDRVFLNLGIDLLKD